MVDKKVKKKIERKINKILKIMTDDDSKNKYILIKELILFHDKYNFSRHDFVDVLLSTKVSIEKEVFVDKIIEWMYHSEYACVILKNDKGNIPLQTAIETGYSTDFICQHIKKYFDWRYLETNIEGDNILHTLLKNCEKNEYDVFRIYKATKNIHPFNRLELIKNNNGETVIDLINKILSKEDKNVIELASTYRLRKNLRNTKAYFYNKHFDEFLDQISEETFVLTNREFIKNNIVFYGDLKENYKSLGLESIEGLLNLCTNKLYDEKLVYGKIISLIKTGLVNLNYIDNNGDDFISLALKTGYSYDFIKRLFNIDFPIFAYEFENYINVLKTCLYNRDDINVYDFYKFLVSKGFNILKENESIFSDTLNINNIDKITTNDDKKKVFKIDYTASFLRSLIICLKEKDLIFENKDIEECLDIYISMDLFERNLHNKLSYFVNDIDLAKMVANLIYENRINSVNIVNDEVTKDEVIKAIDSIVLKVNNSDINDSIIFKDKDESKVLVKINKKVVDCNAEG